MMKRALILACIALVCASAPAQAQTPALAQVVANCGTPPSTYTAGQQRAILQNTAGNQCSAASVSAGTITTITNPVGVKGVDGSAIASASNPVPTSLYPLATSAAAIIPVVSTALESCRVLKASAGNLYSLAITIQATAGVIQVFDATSAPSDGSVTPLWAQAVISNGTFGGSSWNWTIPLRFGTGITACFSSATTPFTKTASATAMFTGAVQ
jgi:hypothetical protein